MPMSTYLAKALLEATLRGVSFTPPTSIYMSLHTANPGDDGSNEVTVVAFPAYTRQDMDKGGAVSAGFDAIAVGQRATQNSLEILFAVHDGAADVNVTHAALWDAATSGNLLMTVALTSARNLSPSDQLVLRVGDFDIDLQ